MQDGHSHAEVTSKHVQVTYAHVEVFGMRCKRHMLIERPLRLEGTLRKKGDGVNEKELSSYFDCRTFTCFDDKRVCV